MVTHHNSGRGPASLEELRDLGLGELEVVAARRAAFDDAQHEGEHLLELHGEALEPALAVPRPRVASPRNAPGLDDLLPLFGLVLAQGLSVI